MKSVWYIDPSTSEKRLNLSTFLIMMGRRWKRIAQEGVFDTETQAYESIVETVTTQNIQEINDLPLPSSWAEITALKILFPDDFFASRHAVAAQEKFPKTNVGQWKFNENGPTTARDWKKNPFRFLPRDLLEGPMRDEPVRDTAERPKRPRSSEAVEGIEECENPSKKRRLVSPSPIYDTFEEIIEDTVKDMTEDVEDTIENTTNDVENTIQNPVEDAISDVEDTVEDTVADLDTSKQATPLLPDSPGDSGDSEDSNECWSEFDDKLAPVRKAAKEGTNITPRMLNSVRKAHLKELKKQHPDKLFKKMKKKHARELRQVRARYEGVITTWLKGVASGVKVLQTTRRELSMLEDYKE